MKKLLLLNPPGTKRYFRDYFCTCVSKAKYYYHPIDLVYLSGILNKDFELSVIDAIAEQASQIQTLENIKKINPEIIIFLISSPSYEEDVPFLIELKSRFPSAEFIGIGDVYREIKSKAFPLHPFLDATLMDFSTSDILAYLNGNKDAPVKNVIFRKGGQIVEGPEKHDYGNFDMPVPRWDLFPLDKYVFPFSIRGKWATMLTDFGCPYTCTFCPMSTVGFKLRKIETVIDEIRLLKKLGINEQFFRDQTFGVNKKRTYEMLDRFINEKLDLSWTCFSRVDVVNEELLKKMKEAGCHTVMFGIETSNEELLIAYKKNIAIKQILDALALCKKVGLKTCGTFIIGLPGETKESILRTIEFSKKIDIDYASFNIATPRFGTSFRKDMLEKNLVDEKIIKMDSAKSKPVFNEKEDGLSNDEIFGLQRKAIKEFYFRPKYLAKRIFKICSIYEFKEHMKQGISILMEI